MLDAFTEYDATDVEQLAGDAEVAKGVIGIPHPYPVGGARRWIEASFADEKEGKQINWAVRLAKTKVLIGCVTLFAIPRHQRAEIAFWIGRPYWNQGYATEAAIAVTAHSFRHLGLGRLDGGHFGWNQASGAVLRKLGMQPEGVRRKYMKRAGGEAEDVVEYGLLREDFLSHHG